MVPTSQFLLITVKFESVETTCVWETDDELESYVIKLAQRCGKHISVADPLLDATLMDGSRIVMKLGVKFQPAVQLSVFDGSRTIRSLLLTSLHSEPCHL